jgi:DegV family protein with EDD domain
MSEFIIFTDGACDLPASYCEEHGVKVVPLYYSLASAVPEKFPGERDFDAKGYYGMLRNGTSIKTSASNVEDFKLLMRPVLERGRDILYVGFSAKLSGTYNAGRLAALDLQDEFPDRKILTVNSKCASLGLALFVNLLVCRKEEGGDLETVYAYAGELSGKIRQWFTVPDLMFLKRGGRIGGATAVIGTMLQIMPLITTDEEGALAMSGKVRGKRAALMKLAELAGEQYATGTTVAISHADAEEDARFVRDILRRKYGIRDVMLQGIGASLGAHCGPGAVAVFYLAKDSTAK